MLKKFFISSLNISYFSLCPTTYRCDSITSPQVLKGVVVDVTPKLSLILAEEALFPQPVPQVSVPASDQLGRPPLDSLLFISIFSVLEQARLGTIFTCSLASAEQKATIFSHYILCACVIHAGVLLACFAARTHCWLMASLLSTETPRLFSAELLPSQSVSSLCHYSEFFLPKCRAHPCEIL